jgi:hypothetical protein
MEEKETELKRKKQNRRKRMENTGERKTMKEKET